MSRRSSFSRIVSPTFMRLPRFALDKADIRVLGDAVLGLFHGSLAVFDLARQQKNSGVRFIQSTNDFIAYPCCSACDKYGLRDNDGVDAERVIGQHTLPRMSAGIVL